MVDRDDTKARDIEILAENGKWHQSLQVHYGVALDSSTLVFRLAVAHVTLNMPIISL